MRVAYFDCFSGISGDMTLGALLACGASEEELRADLSRLKMTGWRLDVEPVSRNGIGATNVTVTVTEPQGHGRHLHHIQEILDASDLPVSVRERAASVFVRLANAEAKIHQTTPDRIHFHEVGAVDAIVDIVGACLALDRLGVDQVQCAPLPMGRGFVQCAHGTIPLPAPAVLELTQGVPLYSVDVEGELVTPTGAALMTTLASGFGPMPPMAPHATGYGAGKSDFGNLPNLLRVIVGDATGIAAGQPEAADVTVIETNLDDFSPQFYDHVSERLFAAGALDVYLTPIQMKKGRPATLLTVLCLQQIADGIADILFTETTTLGVRLTTTRRLCQERSWTSVETSYGAIRIKVGTWNGRETSASPEYEDVRAAATRTGAPIKTVYRAAIRAYEEEAEV